MARIARTISVHLDRLHWDDVIVVTGGGGVGGGPPTASPYLWTIFFKADGSTVHLTASGTLSGSATVVFTPGSHGNLGTRSLQVGNSIIIPANIGQWDSALQPIPVAPSLRKLVGHDLPAFFGAVAVLMIEGSVTDHGAEAGHAALNTAVQSAIEAVMRNIGPDHQMVTQQDIDSVTAGIDQKVSKAIQDAQNVWENLWSLFSPPDAPAGKQVWVWNQDQFAGRSGAMQISQQFWTDRFGLWRVDGTVSIDPMMVFHSLRLFLKVARATSIRDFQPSGSVSLRALMGL